MFLSKQARAEVESYNLTANDDYLTALAQYCEQFDKRPPANDVPNKNMLKALRMCPRLNTADDWARLHATEHYLRKRKSLKASLMRGAVLQSF